MIFRHLILNSFVAKSILFLSAMLIASCGNTKDFQFEQSDSTITFDMSLIKQPFEKACFVRSEYGQFYFDNQIMLYPETGSHSSLNISKDGLKLLQKGYSSEYVLMLLKNEGKYEALPIYGPLYQNGRRTLRYDLDKLGATISVKKYAAPRTCTTNKHDIAYCTKNGSNCTMIFNE